MGFQPMSQKPEHLRPDNLPIFKLSDPGEKTHGQDAHATP